MKNTEPIKLSHLNHIANFDIAARVIRGEAVGQSTADASTTTG